MIVGTIALLSLLFGPGSFDVFFLPGFEKGVKEYVIGKERQKEIAGDIKKVKDLSKEFYKERKADVKEFESLNSSRITTEEDFINLFTKIQAKRVSLQKELIDVRIYTYEKIKPSEWDLINEFTSASAAEILEKEQKKNNKKSKEPFENTLKSISQVVNSEKQKHLIEGLDSFRVEINKLSINLEKVYVANKAVLTKKDATKQDLMKIAEELNVLRRTAYMEVVSFHMLVKKYTNDEGWKKIMKSFNKELAIPN